MKKILFLLTMFIFANAKSQDTCITDARTYTNTNITQNGVRAITAQKLNTSLNKIIDAIECVDGGVFISTDSNTVVNYDVLNSQNTPPVSPSTGDVYLVGTVPTGAWVGHAKDVAEWNGSAWVFTDGVQGDFLYNATTALTYIFRSGNWVQTTGIPALNNGNTISSGLTIGTNNARSLNFETNNINRGRFDSIGRFHIYNLPNASTPDTLVTMSDINGKLTKQGKSTFLSGIGGGDVSQSALDDSINAVRSIRYVDTLYRNLDSLVFKINSVRYAIKDSSGGGGGSALSSITAATATNNIFNTNYKQRWNWNTIAGDTALVLASTSTGAANNLQNLLTVSQSGANTISNQTTYGSIFSNTKTGTTSTNIGLMAIATGATNNFAIEAQNRIKVSNSGSGIRDISFWSSGGENAKIGTGYNGLVDDNIEINQLKNMGIVFKINNTEKIRISNNGYFGIGEIIPSHPLTIRTNFGGFGISLNSRILCDNTTNFYHYTATSNDYSAQFGCATNANTAVISANGIPILYVSHGNTNVGIGVPTTNASAKLDVASTTQGFLPPRMTATQASAIASPAQGLLLFVSDTNGTFTSVGWWGYNGSTWEKLNN